MIKYKEEVFLSDSGHRGLVISGVFWGCTTIDLLRTCFEMQERERIGFFIPGVLFMGISVFLLFKGFSKALKQKNNAIKSRNNFIQNGVLSHGKVTAAGGGYYQKKHYREHHVSRGKSKQFYIWESCWWADIEYYSEIEGIYKRYRAVDLNKNGSTRLVGKEVDIYNLNQAIYINFK